MVSLSLLSTFIHVHFLSLFHTITDTYILYHIHALSLFNTSYIHTDVRTRSVCLYYTHTDTYPVCFLLTHILSISTMLCLTYTYTRILTLLHTHAYIFAYFTESGCQRRVNIVDCFVLVCQSFSAGVSKEAFIITRRSYLQVICILIHHGMCVFPTHTHSLSHILSFFSISLIHTHSHMYILSYTCTYSFSYIRSLSPSLNHTQSLPRVCTLSHTYDFSLSLTHSRTLSLTHTFSLTRTFSSIYTHTHIHAHTQTQTHTISLSHIQLYIIHTLFTKLFIFHKTHTHTYIFIFVHIDSFNRDKLQNSSILCIGLSLVLNIKTDNSINIPGSCNHIILNLCLLRKP